MGIQLESLPITENAYRRTAREAIQEVLSQQDWISDVRELRTVDPDLRRLLKKNLWAACPFERRNRRLVGIYKSELALLWGVDQFKEGPIQPLEEVEIPDPVAEQFSLFG